MHRKNFGKGKEAEGLIYFSLKVGNSLLKIRLEWDASERLYVPIQKHTSRILKLERFPFPRVVADGVVTELKGVEIGVKTADCAGILFVGKNSIGAVHAGWRGLKEGIVEKALCILGEKEKISEIFAFVSPSAKGCCYRVGEEFLDIFPEDTFKRGEHIFMDIQEAVVRRLKEAGVRSIGVLPECTVCSPILPSFRRDRTKKRMLTSIIQL